MRREERGGVSDVADVEVAVAVVVCVWVLASPWMALVRGSRANAVYHPRNIAEMRRQARCIVVTSGV